MLLEDLKRNPIFAAEKGVGFLRFLPFCCVLLFSESFLLKYYFEVFLWTFWLFLETNHRHSRRFVMNVIFVSFGFSEVFNPFSFLGGKQRTSNNLSNDVMSSLVFFFFFCLGRFWSSQV